MYGTALTLFEFVLGVYHLLFLFLLLFFLLLLSLLISTFCLVVGALLFFLHIKH